MSEFAASMAFGAIIIVLFSWDQFKTPSYQGGRDIMRIAANLAPPELCNDALYLRSFAFYTLVLLLIYFATTLFATAPIVQLLGLLPGNAAGTVDLSGTDAAATQKAVDALRSPIGPLVVSLMMVGLAPKAPFLQRIEERVRLIAHRLSGIPTRLVASAQRLRARPLLLSRESGDLLIPADDWRRLEMIAALAERTSRAADLLDDLAKIVAYRAWFLETPAPLGRLRRHRPGLEERNAELAVGIAAFLDTVDAIAVSAGGSASGRPSDGEIELQRRLVAKAAEDARALAADVCAMLALQREHGLFEPDPHATGNGERAAAERILATFLAEESAADVSSHVVGAIWWRATLAVSVVSFAWGALFGNLESGTELYPVAVGTSVALSAFVMYSPAIIVALVLHERQVTDGAAPWPNVFEEDWARWMGPFAGLALATLGAALASGVALNLYWQIGAVGLGPVIAAFWPGVRDALLFEGPRYVLGAMLAIGVVASIDAWRAAGTLALRRRRGLLVLAVTATAMGIWAAAARGLASQYVAHKAGQEMPSLMELLVADDLMLLAAIRAALIGLVTLLVCQRTLTLVIGKPTAPGGGVTAASGVVPARDGASAVGGV